MSNMRKFLEGQEASIHSKDISVVVQGKIDLQITGKCLEKIREVLPESQIILSTWEEEEIGDLLCDVVVFSKDPGEICVDSGEKYLCNVNRQLVGINAGLRLVDRKYILKWRTDILLEDNSFLNYYGIFDKKVYKYLNERLLIANYYTRNPRIFPLLYHPSDWLVFGLKEDVIYYYDIPLWPGIKTDSMLPWRDSSGRAYLYAPEQYFFIQFLLKTGQEVLFVNNSQKTKRGVVDSERLLAECFCILDYRRMINMKFLKYNPNRNNDRFSLLNHSIWKIFYRRFCLETLGSRIPYGVYCVISNILGGW